jgi:uncharacterized protein
MPAMELSLLDKPLAQWWSAILQWLVGIGKTLGIGLPILGVILAIVGYYAALWGWRLVVIVKWRRRGRSRAGHAASSPP